MFRTDLSLRRSSTLTAYALLGVTACCWGANTIFARLAVGEVSPMLLVMWRWAVVVILAWALAWRDIRREWPVLRENLGPIALMGAIGFTLFNALFYKAAHSTTALNMGIIQGTIPVFVLLGALIAFRMPIPPLQSFGVLITLLGVVVVATAGQPQLLATLTLNPGDLMIITACILYAAYTVGLRNRPQVSALVWFAMLATAALLATLPLALAEWAAGAAVAPNAKGWVLIVLIALLPSFLAQVFFIRGVELIGPARSGIFVNLVPVIASGAAVLVLGEPFQWYHAASLALVLSGIWLAERGSA